MSEAAPRSDIESLAELAEKESDRMLARVGNTGAEALARHWSLRARPEQLPPPGEWTVWLVLAGRGFGKTRAGAEWVRGLAERDGGARIALIGATLHEARAVMVEGESGLLAIAPTGWRPGWQPARRRLVWPNGAVASLYGAAQPDALRGAQHSHVWGDEIAKWHRGEAAWDNAMMGMRLGVRPRAMATTTPRPVALVRRLLRNPDVAVTRGATMDNRAHLPGAFVDAMVRDYGGTRLGRQELEGAYLEEAEGALWSHGLIERCRAVDAGVPAMARIVIGVDPPAGTQGDACGIIVGGVDAQGVGWVLEDASVERASPERWAMAVAGARDRWQADRIVAEANNGGAMVESVLRAVDAHAPVRLVHATRGKSARAEPVAALYEAGRVRHAAGFGRLEDELCGMIAGGGYEGPGRSPDRADALVWAMTELMLRGMGAPRVRAP